MSGDDETTWGYVCEGCQTEQDPETGEVYDVDKERNGLSSEGSAHALAQLHRAKSGHRPKIVRNGEKVRWLDE